MGIVAKVAAAQVAATIVAVAIVAVAKVSKIMSAQNREDLGFTV